jgi:hypothetical protein
MNLDPGNGPEFATPIGGMGRHPFHDVFQVGERINLMTLSASRHAIQRSRRPAASVSPDEHLVHSTEHIGPDKASLAALSPVPTSCPSRRQNRMTGGKSASLHRI